MSNARRQTKRRLGPAKSQSWNAILDGAEEALRDEGYAALTSRNIAQRAGVKQQLIYYYFVDMDDLIVSLFRRAADREVKALDQAIASERPLREIWEACTHSQDNKIVSEFTALSNRNELLRKEVIAFIRKMRRTQLKALDTLLQDRELPAVEIPAKALVLIATGLGLALTRDGELGITEGHRQITGVVEDLLAVLEPD